MNAALFWAKVERESGDGCWSWTAALVDGYGSFHVGGKTVYAHRVAYSLLVGPIPDGLVLDHLCRNRACVNPAHLEPVTNRENILRGVGHSARNALKTHCKRGHAFTPANTIDKAERRNCRACDVDRKRAARRRVRI